LLSSIGNRHRSSSFSLLGLRHYTVVTGWDDEQLNNVESKQVPSNLDTLRLTLIQAGDHRSMYSVDDFTDDLSSLISPEEDAIRASFIY